MRRFQPGAMPKEKNMDLPTRASMSLPPSAGASRARLTKMALALIAFLAFLFVARSLLPPRNRVYGLMIDAGSTGSRIHTFTFTRQAQKKDLTVLQEDFFALKPGLSHYKTAPRDAAKSLEPLLDRARKLVPRAARADTPVVLRATAGLRMTGEDAANAILTEVRRTLKESGFRFDSSEWATILSGNEEGIYSWITVNYLMDRPADDTVGTMEMGGGSAQVAYVPRDNSIKAAAGSNCSLPSEAVHYRGQELKLYTTSHLDFGLQKARALVLKNFREQGKLADNPCINTGKPVKVPLPFDDSGAQLSLTGKGDALACRDAVDAALTTPALGPGSCTCDACTYHAAPQPRPIPEFVAIAFYRERTVSIGMDDTITVKTIIEKAKEVCAMTVEEVTKNFPSVPNGEPTDLCLDLTYIALHLERGHGLSPAGKTKLIVKDKIRNFELGWCLGAMQQTMAKLYN